MDLGLYIASTGMVAEQAQQSQLANDLANASTPGFKETGSTEQSFGQMLLENSHTGAAIGNIDAGVQSGRTYVDLTPASIHETGAPLDFAIAGEGFFGVRTTAGVRYTRNGEFTVSAAGLLTDAAGNPVLSQTGGTIKVAAGGRVPPGTVGVFKLRNAVAQGENLFSGTVAGRASGTVRAGALEESGVNPVNAMVGMMSALRTFQSGQQAVAAIGQTLQEAASQVGNVSGA
jgi:flagellar basal-body rod protein FlgF